MSKKRERMPDCPRCGAELGVIEDEEYEYYTCQVCDWPGEKKHQKRA